MVVAPIEPRAAIGTYDASADRFDLLLTGQGVHSLRRQLAEGHCQENGLLDRSGSA